MTTALTSSAHNSFIHSGYFYSASSKSTTTQRHSRQSTDTGSEFHTEALQKTASEGLAQGPYMAARARFEPMTLWGWKATNLQMTHHASQMWGTWQGKHPIKRLLEARSRATFIALFNALVLKFSSDRHFQSPCKTSFNVLFRSPYKYTHLSTTTQKVRSGIGMLRLWINIG